ncbi:hypothetical protein VTP01DRAFT_5964 [Rhizomucor pusillus]|uniref:uncharacterized protein n=1 Tax=Rhizomucor pusillus TaxID=4840 RepID=UPI0037426996
MYIATPSESAKNYTKHWKILCKWRESNMNARETSNTEGDREREREKKRNMSKEKERKEKRKKRRKKVKQSVVKG